MLWKLCSPSFTPSSPYLVLQQQESLSHHSLSSPGLHTHCLEYLTLSPLGPRTNSMNMLQDVSPLHWGQTCSSAGSHHFLCQSTDHTGSLQTACCLSASSSGKDSALLILVTPAPGTKHLITGSRTKYLGVRAEQGWGTTMS